MRSFLSRSAVAVFVAALAAIATQNVSSAQSPGTITCEPGVGPVIPCPCGNNPSGLGRGCDNSLHTGGASLNATGTASLSSDNVLFHVQFVGSTGPSCSGSNVNILTMIYEGTNTITSVPWGDGVLCCGGSYFLLNSQVTNGGMLFFPVPGTTGVSMAAIAAGDPLVVGSTRCYFAVYRDACPTFCTVSQRQKSNSYQMTWGP